VIDITRAALNIVVRREGVEKMSTVQWILPVVCWLLFAAGVNGQEQPQCSRQERVHMSLAGLEEPSQILLTMFPVASRDLCYDLCCQFNSGKSVNQRGASPVAPRRFSVSS
jgi:hypothetical protein